MWAGSHRVRAKTLLPLIRCMHLSQYVPKHPHTLERAKQLTATERMNVSCG